MREFLRGAVRLHILHHAAQVRCTVHGWPRNSHTTATGSAPGLSIPLSTRWRPRGCCGRANRLSVAGLAVPTWRQPRVVGALESTKRQLKELANEVLGDETADEQ